METQQRHFSVVYLIIAVAVLFLIQAYLFAPHPANLAYSDFKVLLSKGKVSDLTIDRQTITGSLPKTGLEGLLPKDKLQELERFGQGQPRFITTRVDDPDLIHELEAQHVRFTGHTENAWLSMLLSWVLPALIFFGLWSFLVRRMGQQGGALMSIGKSKARVYVQHQTGVTFDDVAGIDEARAELMEIVDFLKHPNRYRRLGGKIPKGVLLVGPPGTGKTLLAKAVAGEAGVPFFSLSGSDFVEMFVGVGAARVRDMFQQAEQKAPVIIFIDELDAIGRSRGGPRAFATNDEREQTLNQLLVQMDGFDADASIII